MYQINKIISVISRDNLYIHIQVKFNNKIICNNSKEIQIMYEQM